MIALSSHSRPPELCLSRRKYPVVKGLTHLTQRERRQSSRLIRPRGVAPEAVRRKAGSYRSLVSCSLELRNSDTASPNRDAKMPACRTEGGGGVVIKRRAVMARTR